MDTSVSTANSGSPISIKFNFGEPYQPGTPRATRANQTVQIDLDELERSLQEAIGSAVNHLRELEIPHLIKEAVKPYQAEIQGLKETARVDRIELEVVKDNLIKLEGFSRRYNIKFFGIRENYYETRFDCKRVILQVHIELDPD